MSEEKKNYVFWLDLTRVISIFMVIVIHVSSPLYNHMGRNEFPNWLAGVIYNSIARVSVPLLFMVSGYLLLRREESLLSFFNNRFRKVLIPMGVWLAIYLLWDRGGFANFTLLNALKAMLFAMLTGSVYYHFWFLYSLVAIYFFVPALRGFVRSADETNLWYLALVWFFFGPLMDYLERTFLDAAFVLNFGFFTRYFGYFYLGYVLGRTRFSPRASLLAAAAHLVLIVFTAYSTVALSLKTGEFQDFYLYYLRLNLALMSVFAFIWLKSLGEWLGERASPALMRLFRSLSSASFGVYLIHAMLLTMLRNGTFGFKLTALSAPPYLMIPLLSALVFAVCYALVRLLQRLPYLRAIVPA